MLVHSSEKITLLNDQLMLDHLRLLAFDPVSGWRPASENTFVTLATATQYAQLWLRENPYVDRIAIKFKSRTIVTVKHNGIWLEL